MIRLAGVGQIDHLRVRERENNVGGIIHDQFLQLLMLILAISSINV